jgi:hypothetical protein
VRGGEETGVLDVRDERQLERQLTGRTSPHGSALRLAAGRVPGDERRPTATATSAPQARR